MWALLAQAGFALAGSLMEGRKANEAAKAQNKMNKAANLANALETAQAIGNLQVQQSQLKDQAATSRAAAIRQAALGTGAAENQAANAGVTGASVDAVISDIQRELGTSELEMERAAGVEQFNMQTRLRSLISGAKAGAYSGQRLITSGELVGSALANAALSAGRTYVDNYFKYGSGS